MPRIVRPLNDRWQHSAGAAGQRRTAEVKALKRPELWIDGRPIPSGQIYDLDVVHVPWQRRTVFDRPKHGKIHVRLRACGNRIHIVLDDTAPPGVMMCLVDGVDAFRTGQVHLADNAHVYLNIGLRLRGNDHSLYAHVFGLRAVSAAHDTARGERYAAETT